MERSSSRIVEERKVQDTLPVFSVCPEMDFHSVQSSNAGGQTDSLTSMMFKEGSKMKIKHKASKLEYAGDFEYDESTTDS